MSDDKLRLIARVEDQFTGPLAKLKKDLHGVSDETRRHAGVWRKDWEIARGEVTKFQGVLGGFSPILTAVGVGSFGAAASITGVVAALKSFSGGTQQISMLSRETGVAVDKLRAFGALGERFGVSADSMKQSVGSFATTMFDLRRRWGQAYSDLRAMDLGKLAESLVNAPNMNEALKRAIDGIQAIPEPEVRRRVSRMLFGTDDIARISGAIGGKFSEALAQVQREIGKLDKETEAAAHRFEQSMGRFGSAVERLKQRFLGPALGAAADAMEDIEQRGLLGPETNKPTSPAHRPTDLDEQLDAQMRGQKPLTKEQKDRVNRRTALEGEIASRAAELDYSRKRLVRDPEQERRLTDEIRKLNEELRRLREQGGATLSPSSYGGAVGGNPLIHKAAYGTGGLGGGFGGGIGGGGALGPSAGFGGIGSGSGPLGGGSSGAAGGGSSARAAGGSGVEPPAIFPKAPGSAGGTGPLGGADDAVVNGKRYRYGAFTRAGQGRIQSWLSFLQRPTEEGGLGMPLGRAQAMVAMMQGESGENLNPGAIGDHGTAFGTAQWRLDRADALRKVTGQLGVPWTDVHGQQQHFRREMLGKYRKVYDGIMGAESDEQALRIGIKKFENPAKPELAWQFRMVHLNRLRRRRLTGRDEGDPTGGAAPDGAARQGNPKGLDGQEGVDIGNGLMRMPNGRVRSQTYGAPGQDRDAPHLPIGVPGSGQRAGDAMMRRFYGEGAPVARGPMATGGKGRLDIHLHGATPGTKVKPSMDGLFKDTTVTRGRSQMDMHSA